MKARELFSRMEARFGKHQQGGVVCAYGHKVKEGAISVNQCGRA